MNFIKKKYLNKKSIIIFIIILPLLVMFMRVNNKYISYKNPYNLESIDWNMNVYNFYCKSEDAYVFYNNEQIRGKASSEINVNADTIRAIWKDDPLGEEKTEIIGIQYTMFGWNKSKDISTYEGIGFTHMDMITNLNKELIAICAINDKTEGVEDVKELLEEKGKNIDIKHKKMGITNMKDVYTWFENEIVYQIVIMQPYEWELTEKAYMFIIKEEYQDKINKIRFGNFIYFQYPY